MNNYLVATNKSWNIKDFETYCSRFSGTWSLVTDRDQLTMAYIQSVNPRYIFFPHWSWIVSDEIVQNYECVCFHMSDVPYGRGGSPLQNLIVQGNKETKLTGLRMTEVLDAGPVYYKEPMGLEGSAQEIYVRASKLIYKMIERIIKEEPVPMEQEGEIVNFKRRTPDMSALPKAGNLEELYDHIRMLDADDYPKAYIDYGDFRIVLEAADPIDENNLGAHIKIIKRETKNKKEGCGMDTENTVDFEQKMRERETSRDNLAARIALNSKYQVNDFSAWLFNNMAVSAE